MALKIGKEQGLKTDRALAAKVYSAAHSDVHSEKNSKEKRSGYECTTSILRQARKQSTLPA